MPNITPILNDIIRRVSRKEIRANQSHQPQCPRIPPVRVLVVVR